MVTLDEYVKDLLMQVQSSYETLANLKDKPGDLPVIRREWFRASGLLRSLVARIDASENRSDLYNSIFKMSARYIDSYYFGREIETMADLYSDDPSRLKNIRLKILDSFRDGKFIDRISAAIDDIQ